MSALKTGMIDRELPLNLLDSNVILGRMITDATPAKIEQSEVLTALIRLVAAGDEAALSRLYDLTLSRVYGLALKITGRHDLAEEVCVETYWQSWREATRYDTTRGQPLAWLMVITRTRALDALRRLDRVTYCAEPELFLEHESCPQGSPLDQLLHSERASTLKSALSALTPVQKQLVALAFYKDLSHQEISDQTGLPLGTVKSHLKRAQDNLRGALCPS
jgi:RNA polymerase sigma-70 factor (ECF subfamily)